MDDYSATLAQEDWRTTLLIALTTLCLGGYIFYFTLNTMINVWDIGLGFLALGGLYVLGAILVTILFMYFSVGMFRRILRTNPLARAVALIFIVVAISHLIYIVILW